MFREKHETASVVKKFDAQPHPCPQGAPLQHRVQIPDQILRILQPDREAEDARPGPLSAV